MEEHSRGLDGVREAVVHLERRMDARFEGVDRRFEGLERRLDALDQKLDQRTDALQRELGQRIAGWVLSAQATTLAALVTAIAAALLAR